MLTNAGITDTTVQLEIVSYIMFSLTYRASVNTLLS